MRPTVVVSVAAVILTLFAACGQREQKSPSRPPTSQFKIIGPEITSQYHPTSYTAYNCDGEVSWRVAGTEMFDNGVNATFTFEEVGTYIIHATCEGKEITNQALTVEVTKDNPVPTPDPDPNPVPTPNPPTNPVPTYPPTNPVPYPDNPKNPIPYPDNPVPNPTPCCWWWCR